MINLKINGIDSKLLIIFNFLMKKPNNKIKPTTPELKYYGLHACLAIWKNRPNDIIRIYAHESHLKAISPLLKWCAQQKKAYHIVSSEELARITDSVHHEGLCILAKEPKAMPFHECLASLQSPQCLLYLDGVQNPHNIGSIMRSCAHFGIPYILGGKEKLPALSPSACRIAKGGAESVRLVSLENDAAALKKLKEAGFALIGTSSHKGSSLYSFRFPPKSILMLGGESDGISKEISQLATHHIQIPGTGQVESLNVSVATSICLNEYARQQMGSL